MNENKLKVINGLIQKNDVISLLKSLQESGEIVFCSKDFRCGYPGYKDLQFYAPFYLEFKNGVGWIIYSTNSIRNDRMCIQQWNSEHIKKIRNNVEKSFVIVPDDIVNNKRENNEVIRYKNKIYDSSICSFIDDVLLVSELYENIITYAHSF